MNEVNPLKQYFRRPALYLKLPSGGVGYSEGSLEMPENGELPIYPMTAIDDITSKTPDALFNGSAIVDIIKSCVPNIKDPWEVNSIDLDPILVAIRTASTGDKMEIETTCPECNEDTKYDVNLSRILAGFNPGNYQQLVQIGNDLTIKFRPLKYTEINKANTSQFDVQRMLINLQALPEGEEKLNKSNEVVKVINEMTMRLIADTIEYIKVPEVTVLDKNHIFEFLTNIDSKSYDLIKDTNFSLRKSTENKPLEIKCMHCSKEYQQAFTVNVSDFFG
jgi:hypothetical protein